MKKNRLSIIGMFFLLISSFYSCKKDTEAVQPSAQNIYQVPSWNFGRDDWFLSNQELGAYIFVQKPSFNSEVHRIGYDFSRSKYNNQPILQFPSDSIPNEISYTQNSKFIQLDETRFLQVNTIGTFPGSSNDWYTKVYLINTYLKSAELIARDSLFDVAFATILPDNRIVLLEEKFFRSNGKITCINGLKTEWSKVAAPGVSSPYFSGLLADGQNIYVLHYQYSGGSIPTKPVISSFDFSGTLLKVDKMLSYASNYHFGYISAFKQNVILTGVKFNDSTKRNDFCLLTLDKTLNLINEKVIPINSFIDDWDYFFNDYSLNRFSNLFAKPVMKDDGMWVPVTYSTNKFGASLKLIKFNASLEVEKVKPIIENISPYIPRVALKTDDNYLYLGCSNYKGCFFYRLDHNGDFK